jgi:hypothetical protein
MHPSPRSVRDEEQLGGLVSGIGIVWAARVWISSHWGILGLQLTRGPLEVCALGVLIWLTAKWRRVRYPALQLTASRLNHNNNPL